MAGESDENIVEETVEETDEVVEEDAPEGDAPVRKSSAIYARERIAHKEAKKALEKETEQVEGDDVELSPKARDLIKRELSPIVESLKVQQDEAELREYLSENPDNRKFEKAIRKRMAAWPDVPVEEIAKTITFGSESKTREAKKETVVAQAKQKSLRGTSARAEETTLPTTQEDFQKIYDNVKKNRATVKLGE